MTGTKAKQATIKEARDARGLLEEFNRGFPLSIKDRELLLNVFTHRSYLNEPEGKGLTSYERLEFLGDAVLSQCISHVLYERFPDIEEGELTRLRARLVNRHTLASFAKNLSLDTFILLGKGEAASGGRDNISILAGVFEALLGALYLDSGYQRVFAFIEGLFSPHVDRALLEPSHFDYKPELQELIQKVFKAAPSYALKKESGPPHKKTFVVDVMVKGKVLGTGTGGKKKDAEQAAAREALKILKAGKPLER